MEIRYMKTYSTSFVLKKMQMKTTVKYNYTPIRIAKIKKDSQCWQGCEGT
jgi:hypothetical protein